MHVRKNRNIILFTASNILTVLLVISAIAAIFNPAIYIRESQDWKYQAIAQDWVNILIISPLVFFSSYYGFLKGSLKGRLLLCGAFIGVIYMFLIYAFTLHFGPLFPIYCTILGLSMYLFIITYFTTDIHWIANSYPQNLQKMVGYTFVTIAVLFYLLWMSEIFSAIAIGSAPKSLEMAGLIVNPVHVIDTAFYLPALFMVGILLIRHNLWGSAFAIPMVTSLVLINTGIIAIQIVYIVNGVATFQIVNGIFLAVQIYYLYLLTAILFSMPKIGSSN